MSLPGAEELFRATVEHDTEEPAAPDARSEPATHSEQPTSPEPASPERTAPERTAPERTAPEPTVHAPSTDTAAGASARRPSGRVRHDEKMTVYVTAEELLDIEHARLMLRRSVGRAVDRGRLVRAAVAMALADYDANGDGSDLVRRLRDG